MGNDPIHILLIEDDAGGVIRLSEMVAQVSEHTRITFSHADRLAVGMERVTAGGIDLVLLDLDLPDSEGLDTLSRVYVHNPEIPIVVLCPVAGQEIGIKAVQLGAQDYLSRDELTGPVLMRTVNNAIARKQAERRWNDSDRAQNAIRDIAERNRAGHLLQALNQAAVSLQPVIHPDETFSAVAAELAKMGLGCTVMVVDESGTFLIPKYLSFSPRIIQTAEKLTGINVSRFRIPIASVDAFRETIFHRRALFLNNGEEVVRQVLPEAVKFLARSVTSLLHVPKTINVPMIVEDKVRGLFSVQSDELRSSDVPAIIAFGNQLAAAWHRAGLFEQARKEIEERKRAEEALRLTQFCVDHASVGIMRTGQGAIIASVNEQMCRMLGYSADELVGMHVYDIDPNFPLETWQAHRQSLAHKRSDTFETLHQRKDGTIFPVQVTNSYVEFQEEEYSFSFVQDITGRRQSEALLAEQSNQLKFLYEASQRLSRTLVLEEVYQEVSDFMSRIAPCDCLILSTFDRDARQITCRAFWAKDKWLDVSSFPPIPLEEEGRGTQSRVIRTGQPLLINDYQAQLKTARTSFYIDDETSKVVTEIPPEEEDVTRSALIVPLKLGRMVTGVIQVMSYRLNAYSENQLKLLEALALHIASAEQNALLYAQVQAELEERKRAEAQMRQNAARAQALAHAAARLNAPLELEDVLATVCEVTSEALATPTVSVMLFDPTRQVLVFAATRGLPPEYRSSHTLVPRSIYDGYIHEYGPVFVVPDAPSSGLPDADLYARTNIRTLVSASISREGELVGGLNLYALGEPREFSEGELVLLGGLADQAAQAIANAQLYQAARRRLGQMEALHQIDLAISSSVDLQTTFRIFLDHVLNELGADAADVLLLNSQSKLFEYAAARGFRTHAPEIRHIRPGEGLAGRAMIERKTVSVPDLRHVAPGVRAAFFEREGIVSYYGVPLIAKGYVNGVLEIFHRTPITANQEWIDFLEMLAGQAAIAIDNIELFGNLQHANVELALAYDRTLEGWTRALDLRDRETQGHTQRVTEMTLWLARAMNVDQTTLVHMRRGALLHDIGKIGIPDSILLKAGPLTDEEWEIVRRHPDLANDLLAPIEYLRPALDIPYCHHEKWDGTGYPRRLRGEQIPLAARIFAIVDVWDAVTSNRPYRPAWSREKALEYIRDQAGRHFDPQVTAVFLKSMPPQTETKE